MQEKSPLTVVYRKVDDLIPFARNARTHSEDQVAEIAASIKEYGWTNPILTDGENGIIAGHGRLLAARKLGLEEVPTIDIVGLTDVQKRALIIADNKLALNAGWDLDLLKVELSDLIGGGNENLVTGFSDDELDSLLSSASAETADEATETPAPELPQKTAIQRGDVFVLGMHRVMCGSSTNLDELKKLLGDSKPEILLTDPPYCAGSFSQSTIANTSSIGSDAKDKWGKKRPKIERDNLTARGYISMLTKIFETCPCMFAYVFTEWRMWCYLYDAAETSGFNVRSMIVWNKGSAGMGIGWRPQHELILWGTKKKAEFDLHKGYTNVLSVPRSGNEFHPTEKPEELIRKLIDNTVDFAHGIFDPFGGSGTTLIAAEHFAQPCWTMELTPEYCDVIIRRWQNLTGRQAYREADGRLYDELTPEESE